MRLHTKVVASTMAAVRETQSPRASSDGHCSQHNWTPKKHVDSTAHSNQLNNDGNAKSRPLTLFLVEALSAVAFAHQWQIQNMGANQCVTFRTTQPTEPRHTISKNIQSMAVYFNHQLRKCVTRESSLQGSNPLKLKVKLLISSAFKERQIVTIGE